MSARTGLRRYIPIFVLLSVVIGSNWSRIDSTFKHTTNNFLIDAPKLTPSVLRPLNVPTPGYEESPHPLGTPAPLTVTSHSYRFIGLQSDNKSPVAYDPCRPIHYVIRSKGEPAGGHQIITSAISRVSKATGLHFIYDGLTSETPSFKRAAYQPERYGDRWAPVLIAWVTAAENPKFAGNIDGEGGSVLVARGSDPKIYVTGTVELNSVRLANLLKFSNGTKIARAIVLHELGHVVGLAHVSDIKQLMYPESGYGITDFHAGDLTGLARLGRGACAPNL